LSSCTRLTPRRNPARSGRRVRSCREESQFRGPPPCPQHYLSGILRRFQVVAEGRRSFMDLSRHVNMLCQQVQGLAADSLRGSSVKTGSSRVGRLARGRVGGGDCCACTVRCRSPNVGHGIAQLQWECGAADASPCAVVLPMWATVGIRQWRLDKLLLGQTSGRGDCHSSKLPLSRTFGRGGRPFVM
jgi:hypothetical protein